MAEHPNGRFSISNFPSQDLNTRYSGTVKLGKDLAYRKKDIEITALDTTVSCCVKC